MVNIPTSTIINTASRLPGGGRLTELVNAMQSPLGMAMRFDVLVGGIDLGSWSSCKGLTVTMKPDTVRSLGLNSYQQIMMPALEYEVIELERAVDARSSPKVQAWLVQQVQTWFKAGPNGQPASGETARITLYDTRALPVMSWTLWGVFPSKWAGPALASKESTVAIEKLSLVHEGFLDINV